MRIKNRHSARALLLFGCAALTFVVASSFNLAIAYPSESIARQVSVGNLLVRGPVDQVNSANSRILVLGQWIAVPSSQISDQLLGKSVAVYGAIAPGGAYSASTVVELGSVTYVPGATRLYIKGAISSIDYAYGTARIGLLNIDYTAALADLSAQDLTSGTIVTFTGVRYTDPLKLYAASGRVVATNTVNAEGQTGSGSQALGQTGSGSQTLGQTGSGWQTMGQTGSGSQTLGQTGSGSQTLGQTGSGSQTLGQTGSGWQTMGQTGSGSRTLGQTGSGSQTLGQTGSGSQTLGQTGSGTAIL